MIIINRKNKRQDNLALRLTRKFTPIYATALVSILCVFVYVILIPFYFYLHEFGHFVFGSISWLISTGHLPAFQFHFVTIKSLFNIPVPQQTLINGTINQPLFYFGGSIMSILFFGAICCTYYYKSKNPQRWGAMMLWIIIILFELLGNTFCGTDNPSAQPLIACKENILHIVFIDYLFVWLMIGMLIVTWPLQQKVSSWILQQINKKAKH